MFVRLMSVHRSLVFEWRALFVLQIYPIVTRRCRTDEKMNISSKWVRYKFINVYFFYKFIRFNLTHITNFGLSLEGTGGQYIAHQRGLASTFSLSIRSIKAP